MYGLMTCGSHVTCFDTRIDGTRIKLKFRMKVMQKNFPDVCLFV